MLSFYLLASLAMFGFLTLIWNRRDPFNFMMKLSFGAMTLLALFVTLVHFGYLIKV